MFELTDDKKSGPGWRDVGLVHCKETKVCNLSETICNYLQLYETAGLDSI